MLLNELNDRYSAIIPDKELVEYLLKKEINNNKKKFVVLDDDPTGIQTVHNVFVYTNWSLDSIKQGFMDNNSMFYLLTNSRSLTKEQTTKLHLELISNIINVGKETSKGFIILSRSDSTLRGHYPIETEIIKQVIENKTRTVIDGEIIIPFFKEGGRYTIDNIHYVEDNDALIPVGETEFSKDLTFGYSSSNLCEYIEEKTKGEYLSDETICITLEELRCFNLDSIISKLCSAGDFEKIIVNAIDYIDLKVFCIALFRSMALGRNYMIRTAASFVKVLGGIEDIPLLEADDMIHKDTKNGGMLVVGSYTEKTNRQLARLKSFDGLEFIEFDSDLVLDYDLIEKEINRVVSLSEKYIASGTTVVIYTKRKAFFKINEEEESALAYSVDISDALCEVVKRLQIEPKFILGKGGMTSSDIGVKALSVTRAKALGQIIPGVPVWETDNNSKFPGMPYIIFPGNVGNDESLKKILSKMLIL